MLSFSNLKYIFIGFIKAVKRSSVFEGILTTSFCSMLGKGHTQAAEFAGFVTASSTNGQTQEQRIYSNDPTNNYEFTMAHPSIAKAHKIF